MIICETTLMVRMRRQGSNSHMQKLLCLSRVFLVFFLKDQILKRYNRRNRWLPPHGRNWGSVVAHFAGNNMLVLYQCPGKADGTKISQDQKSSYFMQVLHIEAPVSMLGCGNKDFCPFEEFKEKIVEPHLKHDFDALCKIRAVVREEASSLSSKMSNFFLGLFSQKEKIVEPHLKHDFDALCKIRAVVREEASSLSSKMSNFFLGLFSQKVVLRM